MVEVNQSQARSGSRFAIEPSWRKKSFTCDVTFGPQNPATLTADCETYALFAGFFDWPVVLLYAGTISKKTWFISVFLCVLIWCKTGAKTN